MDEDCVYDVRDDDMVWMAGFFGGEGCIQISRAIPRRGKHHSHSLYVSVVNTDHDVLLLFQHNFGGVITQLKRKTGYKQAWTWVVSSEVAVRCLSKLLPYLKTKHRQALIGLEFETLKRETLTRNRKGGLSEEVEAQRDAYYWALREAK